MILLIGCFGSHPFDVAMETELNRYLDSLEDHKTKEDIFWDEADRQYEEYIDKHFNELYNESIQGIDTQ